MQYEAVRKHQEPQIFHRASRCFLLKNSLQDKKKTLKKAKLKDYVRIYIRFVLFHGEELSCTSAPLLEKLEQHKIHLLHLVPREIFLL